jgi:E-phenylitaconyl-CoA hydratase
MIGYTQQDGVAVIVLDRPERRNALSPDAMVALRDAFLAFEEDKTARVAIITGAGDKAFCAGADIKETQPSTDRSFISSYFDRTADATHPLYIRNIALSRLNLTEIAVNCDLCIASTNASFGLPEVRIGSIPAVAGIQRVVRSLPRPIAMQLILTGEAVDAAAALRWGLVSEVVKPSELMPRAHALARAIARNAPLAVRAAKRLAGKAEELSLAEAAEAEEMLWGHLYASKDRIEGRMAFVEKRPANFVGE